MSDNIFLVSRDVCKPGQYIFPVEFYVIPRLAVLSKNRQTSSSCQKSIKSDSIKWHLLPHTQHSVKTIWIIINHWERSNCSYIIFTHIAEKSGQPRFYTSTPSSIKRSSVGKQASLSQKQQQQTFVLSVAIHFEL